MSPLSKFSPIGKTTSYMILCYELISLAYIMLRYIKHLLTAYSGYKHVQLSSVDTYMCIIAIVNIATTFHVCYVKHFIPLQTVN